MSVEVDYPGRFGNNLFQYIFARLFAKRNGLKVSTEFNHSHIVSMDPPEEGFTSTDGAITEIGEGEWSLDKAWPHGRYLVKGYFQRSPIYYSNRDEILTFAHPASKEIQQSSEDLVVNFRIDSDYRQHLAIHPSWYRGILETEPYRRLFVVADLNDPDFFKEALGGRKYELVGGSPKEQWDFLRGFERIVMSNSTFCWWAVFFGRAKKAFFFKRWIGNNSVFLGDFPGSIDIDGPFLFEKPRELPEKPEKDSIPKPSHKLYKSSTIKKIPIVLPRAMEVSQVLDALGSASPPFDVINVGSDASKTYVYLSESEKRDPVPRLERLLSPSVIKRNLCFYVYPKNPSGWRWHVSKIQDFWKVFNGKKVVTIATDEHTESAQTVMESFSDKSIDFICAQNDPVLWETKHFIPMVSRVASVNPKEFTFYAHAKGVIHGEDQLKRVRQWSDAMYLMNLKHPDLVDKILRKYSAIGCFQASFAVLDWMFCGTFFWFKHSEIFTKNWKDIGSDRYAVEKYLSRHIRIESARSLTPYHDGGTLYGNPPGEDQCKEWLEKQLKKEGLK